MKVLNPLRDKQQDNPVATCERCRGEVWREERRYFWDGKWVCLDCFKTSVNSMLEDDPALLASELQLDVEKYI